MIYVTFSDQPLRTSDTDTWVISGSAAHETDVPTLVAWMQTAWRESEWARNPLGST